MPDETSLGLGNDGINLDATVLYADLTASTKLVDGFGKQFAAEVYKSYLYCAARIIRSNSGEITAYDGDRVMAVYIGTSKNSSAVKTALQLNYAVREIINPALSIQYGQGKYTVKQVVGIDTSNLMAARTGIRGANDLVWVGRAANHAAKLSNLTEAPTYISEDVYKRLRDDYKYSSGVNMWETRFWAPMNYITIYQSTYQWAFN